MANQEQYDMIWEKAMKAQEPLYKVDHDKMLLDAAKMIKRYCITHNCQDCPFHYPKAWEECAISSRDCFDVTYPHRWEV